MILSSCRTVALWKNIGTDQRATVPPLIKTFDFRRAESCAWLRPSIVIILHWRAINLISKNSLHISRTCICSNIPHKSPIWPQNSQLHVISSVDVAMLGIQSIRTPLVLVIKIFDTHCVFSLNILQNTNIKWKLNDLWEVFGNQCRASAQTPSKYRHFSQKLKK